MTCAEFQKVLPYIIDGGADADQETHLKSCEVCSDLVDDLKYIADNAKLLVPMVDPSPKVWEGIQASLEREGLVRPARGMGRFPDPVMAMPPRWGVLNRFAAVAALLLLAIGLIIYQSVRSHPAPDTAAVPSVQALPVVAALDEEDERLLQQVSDRTPAARATYADSLRSVNAYIADAQKAVNKNPADDEARDHLMSACGQKAMLYEMALSRSLQ